MLDEDQDGIEISIINPTKTWFFHGILFFPPIEFFTCHDAAASLNSYSMSLASSLFVYQFVCLFVHQMLLRFWFGV